MISTKYMEMTSDSKMSKIRCRVCQADVYEAPASLVVDPKMMEMALHHFEVEHKISRIDILLDIEKAFQKKEGKNPS